MHSWSFKFVFGHRREREKKWYILILLIFSNCYSICFLGVSFSSISIIFHSFWRRHYCRWRAAKSSHLLYPYGFEQLYESLWYHTCYGLYGLIRVATPLSRQFRKATYIPDLFNSVYRRIIKCSVFWSFEFALIATLYTNLPSTHEYIMIVILSIIVALKGGFSLCSYKFSSGISFS